MMFLSTDIHTHAKSKPVKGYYNSESTDYFMSISETMWQKTLPLFQ